MMPSSCAHRLFRAILGRCVSTGAERAAQSRGRGTAHSSRMASGARDLRADWSDANISDIPLRRGPQVRSMLTIPHPSTRPAPSMHG